MVKTERIPAITVEICVLSTWTVKICSDVCMSLNFMHFLVSEISANSFCTLLCRKMLQSRQIEAAVPNIPKGHAPGRAEISSL